MKSLASLPWLFLAGALGASPTWLPRQFEPVPATGSDSLLSSYLRTQRMDFAPDTHRIGVVRSDSLDIACHLWLVPQSRGTLFLVHGYYNHTGTWAPHIRRWIGQGFSVVALDLPGHGLSDGPRMDIDSIERYSHALEAVEARVKDLAPMPWVVVGHSLGGTVVLDRAVHPSYPYSHSVLLAPLIHYAGWTKIGLALPVVGAFKDYVTRGRAISSSSDSVFLNRLQTDSLEGWKTGISWLRAVRNWNEKMDTLKLATSRWVLFAGGLDKTVDFTYTDQWLPPRAEGLQVLRYGQARHHLHNEAAPEGDRVRTSLDSVLQSSLPAERK